MAGKNGRSAFDLKADLFDKPRSYSFFQAIRLLRILLIQATGGSEEPLFHDLLRVRPLLSLSFPGTDVYGVEDIPQEDGNKFLLTATFLGLYGASSPLPTHYTEDLLDEASDDKSVTRDFLDIFNHPFYRLFFQVWTKYRWSIKITEEDSEDNIERLFCLLGYGSKEYRSDMPHPKRFLRYIGLFTQYPRSAMGLKALLSDAMDVPNIDVVPNVHRKVAIPEEQRCLLGLQGHVLAEDCYLGQEIDDRMGKIVVRAGPLSDEKYHQLLPSGPLYEEIGVLCKEYLNQPLERELVLVLDREEARTVELGGLKWSRLGWDTWTFAGNRIEGEAEASFPFHV